MDGTDSRRIVIAGASAAGLKTASRLKRLRPDWSVTVVEERPEFSFGACGLPYVVSGDIEDAEKLRRTGDGALRDEAFFRDVKSVDVRAGFRAVHVDRAAGVLVAQPVGGGEAVSLRWDDLVIATGARPRRLPGQPDHPRVRGFRTLADARGLVSGLQSGGIGSAVIAGAGLVGLELTEAFRGLWGIDVTLIEAAPQVLPGLLDAEMAAVVEKTVRDNGVEVVLDSPIERFSATGEAVEVFAGGRGFPADVAIVAVGAAPVVDLAVTAGASLGPTGAIAVDERMATSVPHVWAAGDCVEVRSAVTGSPAWFPLGSLANRQGRVLANVLAGRDDRFPPVAGATAVKVFELNVAATGQVRAAALTGGLKSRSAWVSAHDRAGYWPEAREIFVNLVYDTETRDILGVQAVGEGDVTKRVDCAAQHLVVGATIDDLAHLEHAYAPPYAPALEPLAIAAFAAQNQEDGVEAAPPSTPFAGERVLDVRHPGEVAERPTGAPDVTVLPLEELQARIDGLPGADWLVVCERGGRSAEAVRILMAAGRKGRYLAGGMHLRGRQ